MDDGGLIINKNGVTVWRWQEKILPALLQVITTKLPLRLSICGPRVCDAAKFGITAINEGEENEFPKLEEKVYIKLSPDPYTKCSVPLLSLTILGI